MFEKIIKSLLLASALGVIVMEDVANADCMNCTCVDRNNNYKTKQLGSRPSKAICTVDCKKIPSELPSKPPLEFFNCGGGIV